MVQKVADGLTEKLLSLIVFSANALTAYYALMPVFFIFTVTAIKEGLFIYFVIVTHTISKLRNKPEKGWLRKL